MSPAASTFVNFLAAAEPYLIGAAVAILAWMVKSVIALQRFQVRATDWHEDQLKHEARLRVHSDRFDQMMEATTQNRAAIDGLREMHRASQRKLELWFDNTADQLKRIETVCSRDSS